MNNDPVNHPKHYTSHPSGIECIKITRHMGFNLGNALKYIWRADEKGNAIQDLLKARWYINDELDKRGWSEGGMNEDMAKNAQWTEKWAHDNSSLIEKIKADAEDEDGPARDKITPLPEQKPSIGNLAIHSILEKILQEYDFAVAKHPNWPKDVVHAMAILQEEVGELQKEVVEFNSERVTMNLTKEAYQVAAMIIRLLMNMNSYV